jgi:hypothetical protein
VRSGESRGLARILAASWIREGRVLDAWQLLVRHSDPRHFDDLEDEVRVVAAIRGHVGSPAAARRALKELLHGKEILYDSKSELSVVAHVISPGGLGEGSIRLRFDDALGVEIRGAEPRSDAELTTRLHLWARSLRPAALVVDALDPGAWARVDVFIPGPQGPWVQSHLVTHIGATIPLPERLRARGICLE